MGMYVQNVLLNVKIHVQNNHLIFNVMNVMLDIIKEQVIVYYVKHHVRLVNQQKMHALLVLVVIILQLIKYVQNVEQIIVEIVKYHLENV